LFVLCVLATRYTAQTPEQIYTQNTPEDIVPVKNVFWGSDD